MRTDDRLTVMVGMSVWAVLWLVALVLHERLAEAGHGWWIWTPPTGLALGLLALLYLHRRDRPRK